MVLIILGGITSTITTLFIYSSLVLAKKSDAIYERELNHYK